MNASDEAVAVLLKLPASTLLELGSALSDGMLRHGFSEQSLQSFAGAQTRGVNEALRHLTADGLSLPTIGLLCRGIGNALRERDEVERNVQLVLSGPEVPGAPVVDTRTTVMSLFEEASSEVMISSYVFHEAAEFFQRLAEKHDADPAFRVVFLLDLSHRRTSAREPAAVLAPAFLAEFRKKHWPGKRVPEIWYDPRAFAPDETGGGVLHAKTVIVDRSAALITSANFTGAAQTRNIEAGVLLREPRVVARLHAYFTGLMSEGILRSLIGGL
jgi:phosphatidylserine/phosphatidylglycerophosphate/cardiolipin synthase-like enzyme